MKTVIIASFLLAGLSPAFALDNSYKDPEPMNPLQVRELWYKAYNRLVSDPKTFKQHDCFNTAKTYCQDTMANHDVQTSDKTKYIGLLAIEFNGETIRKFCLVSLDSIDRTCVNDKDGKFQFQVWDSAAAGWQNTGGE